MHLGRTRFKTEIVAEFAKPERPSKKVIIYADGMPTVPSKKDFLLHWTNLGYWVFHIRYRGTWESGGQFLKESPEQDILDVMDEIPRGFTDIWSGEQHIVQPKSFVLIGGSFGGPAVLLASRDPRVSKVVAVSPVVDFTYPSRAEPMDWLEGFVRDAFGEGYRFDTKDWKRLANGHFYNPADHIDEIFGKKVFILHSKDDESVDYRPVQEFAEEIGATFVLKRVGGHLSPRILTRSPLRKRIEAFIAKK